MFTCPFCEREFKREKAFLNHKCKQKIRFDTLKTLQGVQGYNYYVKWFNLQQRGTPTKDAFMLSKYFNNFIAFAEFTTKVKMSDPEYFIRIMIKKNFSPDMWTMDEVYAIYLDYAIYSMPAKTQINRSLKFLTKLSIKMECSYSELIDMMEASELLFFIKQGTISPWIIMNSTKIRDVFQDEQHQDEYTILKTLIKPVFWRYKFKRDPDGLKYAKNIIKEMGI